MAKGRVEVKWSLPENDQLILTWTEKGGPAVQQPLHEGFGTRMMKQMIKDQQQGDFRLDWGAEGLACEIILPV
jgi:two-component sensor histidine kinase